MRTPLVERARRGDDVAFGELVDADGDRCFAIAYRILRDVEAAQDAVQQAFLLAWRDLPKLRDVERYDVWLRSPARERVLRRIRRHRRWSGRIRALPVDGPAGPDPMVTVDDRDLIERVFAKLTPEHRAVVRARTLCGPAARRRSPRSSACRSAP